MSSEKLVAWRASAPPYPQFTLEAYRQTHPSNKTGLFFHTPEEAQALFELPAGLLRSLEHRYLFLDADSSVTNVVQGLMQQVKQFGTPLIGLHVRAGDEAMQTEKRTTVGA